MDKKEVLERIEKENIKFIDLWFTDILGVIKNITIPARDAEKALHEGIWFDGSSIEGFGRICESDMYLVPDPDTFTILPFHKEEQKTARLICDIYSSDYKPFAGDPRYVLKRMLSKAKEMGFEYKVGPELEFFIYRRTENKVEPVLTDRVGYFDLGGDIALTIKKEIINVLDSIGIHAETTHHEVAPGQHEVDLRYGDALRIADDIVTTKAVIREVAERKGLFATFMPKPFYGVNGSGMHVHQSLFKNGENAFYDATRDNGLSDIALKFISGQLKHIKGIVAITNPIVNSYKRLVPGYEAPTYICWGSMNRSALIRIPRINPKRPMSTRCELRCPDPSTNPYLAFSVMLGTGLKGMEDNVKIIEPVDENVFEGNVKLDELPGSLLEALEHMKKSEIAREILGDYLFDKYIEIKMKEWSEYRIQVTGWEIEKYINIY